MDPILDLAERFGLRVVEDACQAHGAEYFSKRQNRWLKAGSMGRAAAFSFYPGKNLGACGEAGAVTTNDGDIARKIRMLRDHGQAKKYYHDMEGYNGRLDSIQAGILHVKLRHLTAWNERRRECASRYQELLGAASEVIRLPYRAFLVQGRFPPLCRPGSEPGTTSEPPGCGWYRDGNSLSYSPPPAKRLQRPWLPRG